MNKPIDLPAPSAAARQHSSALTQRIAEAIQQQGSINFQRFMQMALYEPGLGYYSAGATKFGEHGDFITAPLLSPLFSQCIATQCQQMINSDSYLLELGAGTGIMALDILQQLATLQCLPKKYLILETSPDLKQRQQTLIKQQAPQLLASVEWLETLPAEPFKGVIIANEVMDAMPVHRFCSNQTLQEYYVTYDDNQFAWQLQDCQNQQLLQALDKMNFSQLIEHTSHYSSEINLMLPAWIKSLAACLQQGMILLIDYGYTRHEYFHPQRHMGTLMCHYRQRAHDNPLIFPGIQDITAHVDFTTVAEAALQAGLDVDGFTHQAAFLLNCGIAATTPNDYQTAQHIKRLTLPSEMGERFKAIALTKNNHEQLIGFRQFDQTERL